ncbi:TetR family transcriptional regulator C-terminal domain-containing protein [Clostridium sp. CM028]|nr:TetR family transcriptional regulator C-terminal domain-containing protein [Clostridium sp. CM027]MBW9149741.1 TetR family transcriptional regulator C-terminal domain-containing protein [Clostridium sp. CM028]UVE42081.1 TetR family transcriptional regulator C-terminal domain-containing protein [Clostridium sp. CM027]WLC62692.1 TetR family transcriptional regulator C-terminal domain-containing protein [Clostridium sp. CM028]
MPFPKENIQYALTSSTGGFMHILLRWLNDSTQKSPEEMAIVVKDLVSICNYSNPIKKANQS